jgi:hypothetical protein
MKVSGIVIEETKTLVPNKEHKNFTESDTIVPKGTKVDGELKSIEGLRKGEKFIYRVFVTNDGQIIFQNKINNLMPVTEVKLGADASTTPTMVNLKPAEIFNKMRFAGVVVGGLSGFAYAKYRKHDLRKSAMYIGIGALVGFGVAYVIDTRKKAVVTPSK